MSPLKTLSLNMRDMFSTRDTFHLEMSPLNELLLNMWAMLMAPETFHLEMSPLNSLCMNKPSNDWMRETSKWLRSHCGPCSAMA